MAREIDVDVLLAALHERWQATVEQARQANQRASQAIHAMARVRVDSAEYRDHRQELRDAIQVDAQATARAEGLEQAQRLARDLCGRAEAAGEEAQIAAPPPEADPR
jgi:hypothetical protein